MNIKDLYASVTQKMIDELETGCPPWIRPWKISRHNGGSIIPANAITGRAYSGINIPILWSVSESKGYEVNTFLTFKQANELGGKVKKGEKAIPITFTKTGITKDDVTGEERKSYFLRVYYVFNVAQVEGIESKVGIIRTVQEKPLAEYERDAITFCGRTGSQVKHGGNVAAFIPSKDYITMPPRHAFKSNADYIATLLHEHIHWTGAEKRINRNMSGRFGTASYAAEELVAELGAAFMCAELGVVGDLRHAAYIKDWIKLLKEDDRAIFTAASKASQACDYLRKLVDSKSNHAEEAA